MNENKLKTIIRDYRIMGVNGLGQLMHFDKIPSLRSMLLCSDFYISKKKMADGFGKKEYLIKGFVHSWIFNIVYDKELIEENQLPLPLEYYLEVDNKNKTIFIKPKY